MGVHRPPVDNNKFRSQANILLTVRFCSARPARTLEYTGKYSHEQHVQGSRLQAHGATPPLQLHGRAEDTSNAALREDFTVQHDTRST
eukprot:9094835-Pyramimonas_sp.AAC.1